MNEGEMALLPQEWFTPVKNRYAVCLSGRWKGWVFRQHPDGHWVSQGRLEMFFPEVPVEVEIP